VHRVTRGVHEHRKSPKAVERVEDGDEI
jgi:hypothetical protein